MPALVPETTAGKRCAALNLREAPDRAQFERLLQQADVLVCGLRSDALEALECLKSWAKEGVLLSNFYRFNTFPEPDLMVDNLLV